MTLSGSPRYFFGVLLFFITVPAAARAQNPQPVQAPLPSLSAAQPATISGQIRRSSTLRAVSKATILVEGTALQATSDNDGRFSIPAVPAGTHHLVIAAPGLMPLRVEINIGNAPPTPLDVLLDTEVHYTG